MIPSENDLPTEDTDMFQGYTSETLDFMWGIRFNNDRAWFQAHKEEYLQDRKSTRLNSSH